METQSKNLWQRMLEMIFPAFCVDCKTEGSFLCPNCLKNIPIQQHQCCPVCYSKNESGKVCDGCKSKNLFLDGLIAASPFDKSILLQQCIHVLKYDFVDELAQPLGEILLKTLQESVKNGVIGMENVKTKPISQENIEATSCVKEHIILCPVPLHHKRLAWRGFNQSELLARRIVQLSPDFRKVQLLRRLHYQKPQMELTREQRLKNVENVFALADQKNSGEGVLPAEASLKNSTVFLIDDVATTLATLNNCAKVLKQAGAHMVYGLVLARVY